MVSIKLDWFNSVSLFLKLWITGVIKWEPKYKRLDLIVEILINRTKKYINDNNIICHNADDVLRITLNNILPHETGEYNEVIKVLDDADKYITIDE